MNKLKRSILCLALAFVVMITSVTPAFAISYETQLEKTIEKQEPLIEMYNQIIEVPEEKSRSVASFEYGGAWIDENYLHINIVGNLQTGSSYYSSLCTDSDSLKFHSVEYSYEDLSNLAYEITLIAPNSVVGVGVDEVKNVVTLGVDKSLIEENELSTESAQENFLSSLEKEINEAVQTLSVDKIASCFVHSELPLELVFEYPIVPSANLVGGMELSSGYSLGTCGTYWNEDNEQIDVMVMCGHGLTVGTQMYDVSTGSRRLIGPVIEKQCTGGYYYDYAVIEITNTSTFTPTSQVNGITLTSEATSHPVGTRVLKQGVNGFTAATITHSSYAANYEIAGGYVYGLVRADIVSGYIGTCGRGDSGGTVYAGTTFYGVHSGSNASDDYPDATYLIYSPSNGIPGFDIF